MVVSILKQGATYKDINIEQSTAATPWRFATSLCSSFAGVEQQKKFASFCCCKWL